MPLSDVADIIKTYWNGNIPWISIKDFINQNTVYYTEKSVAELGLNNSSTKLLIRGGLIISAYRYSRGSF